MPDYTALAKTAKRLVDAAGRQVTFVQYNQAPSDSAKPWLGPSDPRETPEQSHLLKAVAVDVGTALRLGMATISEDLLRRTSQFFIVAPGPDFAGDLRAVHEVVDEATRWSVVNVQTLRPADVTLLHYVAVGR